MKGLLVINSLEGGGAERIFSHLSRELGIFDPSLSYRIIVLDNIAAAYDVPDNLVVRCRFNNNALKLVWFIFYVHRYKPDFSLSFLTRANLFNVISGLIFKQKVILSERSATRIRIQGRFYSFKKRIIEAFYKKSAAIIAVSKGVADTLIEDFNIEPQKISVISNPVEIPDALHTSKYDKDSYIVCVGRLVKTKKLDILLRSFAKIDGRVKLVVLGKGPEEQNLRKLADDLGITNKVHFEGFIENPYPYIRNSLFLILPSSLEGFPNVLIEAMALSKAVISTDCKYGPAEILELKNPIRYGSYSRTQYGLMVNVDDINGLASAIATLTSDITLREELSHNAFRRSLAFDKRSFFENIIRVIKESEPPLSG